MNFLFRAYRLRTSNLIAFAYMRLLLTLWSRRSAVEGITRSWGRRFV